MHYSKELYSQFFVFSLKRPWKSEICLVDRWTPRPLFWSLMGELTVLIIIEPGRIFFTYLLTHWNYPFISLFPSPPFLLLGIWYVSQQASPYYYLQFCCLDLFSVPGRVYEYPWDISIDLAVDYSSASLWEQTLETKARSVLLRSYSLYGRMAWEIIWGPVYHGL